MFTAVIIGQFQKYLLNIFILSWKYHLFPYFMSIVYISCILYITELILAWVYLYINFHLSQMNNCVKHGLSNSGWAKCLRMHWRAIVISWRKTSCRPVCTNDVHKVPKYSRQMPNIYRLNYCFAGSKGKFLRLKKGAVPTQNLPKRSCDPSPKAERVRLRRERLGKRVKNKNLDFERYGRKPSEVTSTFFLCN